MQLQGYDEEKIQRSVPIFYSVEIYNTKATMLLFGVTIQTNITNEKRGEV